MVDETSHWMSAMKQGSKYYIKYDSFGELFDPKNFTAGDPTIRNGLPLFNIRRVSKEKFDTYLSFLKTGDRAYLTLARRIMDNV